MHDEITVDLAELTKLFVACPKQDCGAEIGFDLMKEHPSKEAHCPVCGAALDQADCGPIQSPTTWVFSFKRLLDAKGKRCMFFRISTSAQPTESELAKTCRAGK